MKRSIVKQGAATLMVSLPSKWTKKYHLNKGDEVDIVEKGRDLLITSEVVPEIRKATINISELKDIWRRVISALYKAGYDEIKINFSKPEDISKIYSVLHEFVGFEIISQTEKGCTIKEIVEAKETNFNSITSRTFNMLLSIAEDCSNALKNKNIEILGTIPERDLIINKYANFCRRIINKGLVNQNDAPMLYYIIEGLESIGDIYKDFARYSFEAKTMPDKKIIEIFERVNMLLNDFQIIFSNFDREKIVDLGSRILKTIKEINEMFKTKSVSESRMLNYISEILQTIQNLVGPLLILNSEKL